MVVMMLRLFFIITTLHGVYMIFHQPRYNTAGCPIFNQDIEEGYRSAYPLYIRTRPFTASTIGVYMTIRIQNQDVPAARHHIIPYATLRDFFNRLLERSPATSDLQDFAPVLRYLVQHSRLVGVDADDLNALDIVIDNIIMGRYHGGSQRFVFSERQMNVIIPMLHTIFVWMPGNIFIGPSNRPDDPGNNFEYDAEPFVDPRNFYRLHEMYFLMTAYIRDENEVFHMGRVIPVTINRIVELIENLNQVISLYHGVFWRMDPDFHPVITWDHIQNLPLDIVQPHSRQRRDLNSTSEKCLQPFVQKLSSFPDQYCILAKQIERKIIVALL